MGSQNESLPACRSWSSLWCDILFNGFDFFLFYLKRLKHLRKMFDDRKTINQIGDLLWLCQILTDLFDGAGKSKNHIFRLISTIQFSTHIKYELHSNGRNYLRNFFFGFFFWIVPTTIKFAIRQNVVTHSILIPMETIYQHEIIGIYKYIRETNEKI